MPILHLPDRGVVKVVGEDARDFLNGLVTNDMTLVAPGAPRFAALLSPQGKVLVDFIITEADPRDGGGFFLDCPLVLAGDIVQRCNRYKLRSKVIIEDLSAILGVAVVLDEAVFDPEDYLAYPDPRLKNLGMRLIGERNQIAAMGSDFDAYRAFRIRHALPEGGQDFAYNDAYPHECLMDQLGGVDFRKGCYVGQEIVSRMEHRGTARTRIVAVTYPEGFAPEAGTEVVAGDTVIGRTGSQYKGHGLAMVRLDRLADALREGKPVSAGGLPLVAHQPAYASFSVPAASY